TRFVQYLVRIPARGSQKGNEAEDYSSRHCCGQSETQHSSVHWNRFDSGDAEIRYIVREQFQQESSAPEGENHTRSSARNREYRAFGEHLAHEPRTPGAKRSSNGGFMFAGRRTRHQKV